MKTPRKKPVKKQRSSRPPERSRPKTRPAQKRPAAKPKFSKTPRHQKEGEDLKRVWKPSTLLYPVPAVLISSANRDGKFNVCTVAWTGTACSDPPMLAISLRPERLSHEYITQTREFVVNMPSEALVRRTDYCGMVSGRKVDKFAQTGMTAAPASQVKAPIVVECPMNLECVVKKTLELGTHTMFVAEIVAVQVDNDLFTLKGRLALEKAGLFACVHGGYYGLGKQLGKFGYSVKRKGK